MVKDLIFLKTCLFDIQPELSVVGYRSPKTSTKRINLGKSIFFI